METRILSKIEKIRNSLGTCLPSPIQPDINTMNLILGECEKEGVVLFTRIVASSQFLEQNNDMLRVRMTAEHTWLDMHTHETYGPVRITTDTDGLVEHSMNALSYNKAMAIATSLNMI